MKTALNLARIVHRLLVDPRGWSVDGIEEELEIQPRTYRKYRKALQDEFAPFLSRDGTPLIAEVKSGAKRYLKLIETPSTDYSEASFAGRIASMYLASQLLHFLRQTPVHDAFGEIFEEFRSRFQDRPFVQRQLRNVDRLFFAVPFAPKDYTQKGPVLDTLLNAMILCHRIELTYQSTARSEAVTDTMEPLSLVSYRSGLYLYARYAGGERIYIYSVDRIASVRRLGETFHYPPPEEYSPQQMSQGSFGIFQSTSSENVEVELIFANIEWLQRDLTERHWHPTQRFEKLDDGRLQLTFVVPSMTEVWPWIRSFGEDVEVVKPG